MRSSNFFTSQWSWLKIKWLKLFTFSPLGAHDECCFNFMTAYDEFLTTNNYNSSKKWRKSLFHSVCYHYSPNNFILVLQMPCKAWHFNSKCRHKYSTRVDFYNKYIQNSAKSNGPNQTEMLFLRSPVWHWLKTISDWQDSEMERCHYHGAQVHSYVQRTQRTIRSSCFHTIKSSQYQDILY